MSGRNAWERSLQNFISIKESPFNAAGDGTDESAIVLAAIAALPTGGGTIYFPPGRYKLKLGGITKTNVRFQGCGFYPDSSLNTQFVPADNTDYVFQVGDGSTLCKGFQMEGIAIDGLGSGAKGIKINGADRCSYSRFSIQGFTTHGLYITSPASLGTFYQFFSDFIMSTNGSASAIGVEVDYGSTAAAALFFSNGNINNQSGSSFAMKITRAVVNMNNVWVQVGAGTGAGISLASTGGTIGQIIGSGTVIVDSDNSTDALLTLDQNLRVGDVCSGVYIDGTVTMPAGTSSAISGHEQISEGAMLSNSYVNANLYFSDGATPYLSYTFPTDVRIYRTGNALFFASGSSGRIEAQPGNGAFLLTYAGAGEFQNNNSSASKTTIWRTDAGGNMVLVPPSGSNVIVPRGDAVATGGAVIQKADINTTAVGNVGAGEDDLITYSLAANSLSANGKGVKITAWGTTANNSNPKTVKLYFGSAILTTALTVSQVGVWRIEATIFRTASNAQDYSAQMLQGGATTIVDVEGGSLTETDSSAITIKCTGTVTDGGGGINNNDIVQEGSLVEFFN